MARAKKNVRLSDIVRKVNERNAKSRCSRDVRDGWNDLVATLLMDADAYSGFRYLDSTNVPLGCEPGIVYGRDENGDRDNRENKYPDTSRCEFFICADIA